MSFTSYCMWSILSIFNDNQLTDLLMCCQEFYYNYTQQGEAMADLKTSTSSNVVDNISTVFGPSVAK